MAAITPLSRDVLKLNEGKEITITSKSAAFAVDAKGGDYKILLMFANAGQNDATATIAVGDGVQGIGADLVITVKAGKTVGAVLDSGYFKFVNDGTNANGGYRHCFKITPSAALSVSAIELPQ